MNREKRQAIFERLRAADPNPTTELRFDSSFELLVAVILSAQSTDVAVNAATQELYKVARTPDQIIALGLDRLKEYIRTIGLYNAKAKNIIAMSQILINRYNGQVPDQREQLEELPGVGRKTANVVLNTAFGLPTIAVDTHIFRVGNRTKIAWGKTPREVEDRLVRLVPEEFQQGAHHWLILHGRYVCKARRPLCPECTINDLCEYRRKETEPKS